MKILLCNLERTNSGQPDCNCRVDVTGIPFCESMDKCIYAEKFCLVNDDGKEQNK